MYLNYRYTPDTMTGHYSQIRDYFAIFSTGHYKRVTMTGHKIKFVYNDRSLCPGYNGKAKSN